MRADEQAVVFARANERAGKPKCVDGPAENAGPKENAAKDEGAAEDEGAAVLEATARLLT